MNEAHVESPEPRHDTHEPRDLAREPRAASRRARAGAESALLVLAALVAVGGVMFAIGRLTAPSAAVVGRLGAASGAVSDAPGPGRARGAAQGGLLGAGGSLTVRGTVGSISSTALTLTLENGQTVEIPVDASTTYHRQAAGSASDVRPGTTVEVRVSGGRQVGPNASAAPSASGRPALGTARDVTIVSP